MADVNAGSISVEMKMGTTQLEAGAARAKAIAIQTKKELDNILIASPFTGRSAMSAGIREAAGGFGAHGGVSTMDKYMSALNFGSMGPGRYMSMMPRDQLAMIQNSATAGWLKEDLRVAKSMNNMRREAMTSYKQDLSRLNMPSPEQVLHDIESSNHAKMKREVYTGYRQDLSRLNMPSPEQVLHNVRMQNAKQEAKEAKRVADEAKRTMIQQNQQWREAQRQQSNAARMDPSMNMRRGFFGGMFGSPTGAASTIGQSAMIGSIAGLAGGMVAMGTMRAIRGIESAIIGLGKAAIDTSSDIEMLRLRLNTITKGEGEKFFNQLYESAVELRAPMEGLIKSFSKMTAMGFQPTMEQLKGLVNYTRMLGDPENLDYIVLAFSQIASKGKLEMQEMRQLAERGLPALSIIQEKMNIPMNKIGDIGKLFIPGAKAVKVLLDEIATRTGNIQNEYKQTMQGMIDYTKLLWWQMKKTMGDAGMYDSFKSLLEKLVEVMESDGFKNMAKDIGNAFAGLFSGLEKTVGFMKDNRGWLGPLFKYLGMPIGGALGGGLVGGGLGFMFGGPPGAAAGALYGALGGSTASSAASITYDIAKMNGARSTGKGEAWDNYRKQEAESKAHANDVNDNWAILGTTIGGAVVGGLMGGPLGALAGGMTGWITSLAGGLNNNRLGMNKPEYYTEGIEYTSGQMKEQYNLSQVAAKQREEAKAAKNVEMMNAAGYETFRNDAKKEWKNRNLEGLDKSLMEVDKFFDSMQDAAAKRSEEYVDAAMQFVADLRKGGKMEVTKKFIQDFWDGMGEIAGDIKSKYTTGFAKVKLDIDRYFEKMEESALELPAGKERTKAWREVQNRKKTSMDYESGEYWSGFWKTMGTAAEEGTRTFRDALAEVTLNPFQLAVRKINEEAKEFAKGSTELKKLLDEAVKSGDLNLEQARAVWKANTPASEDIELWRKKSLEKLNEPQPWSTPVAGSQEARNVMFGGGGPLNKIEANTAKSASIQEQTLTVIRTWTPTIGNTDLLDSMLQ